MDASGAPFWLGCPSWHAWHRGILTRGPEHDYYTALYAKLGLGTGEMIDIFGIEETWTKQRAIAHLVNHS
jgi:hypothetical protein